jgi:hypothetical protein
VPPPVRPDAADSGFRRVRLATARSFRRRARARSRGRRSAGARARRVVPPPDAQPGRRAAAQERRENVSSSAASVCATQPPCRHRRGPDDRARTSPEPLHRESVFALEDENAILRGQHRTAPLPSTARFAPTVRLNCAVFSSLRVPRIGALGLERRLAFVHQPARPQTRDRRSEPPIHAVSPVCAVPNRSWPRIDKLGVTGSSPVPPTRRNPS